MGLRFFKLLSGSHSEAEYDLDGDLKEDGTIQTYGVGDVVPSPYDLCKLFVNKFEEVADDEGTVLPTRTRLAGKFRRKVGETVKPSPERQEDRDKRTGTGTVGQRKTLSAGRGTATDSGAGEEPDGGHPADDTEEAGTTEEREEGTAEAPDFGEDITDQFDQAEGADMKVFRNDSGAYTLVHTSDPERAVEETTTKRDMIAAIKKHSR